MKYLISKEFFKESADIAKQMGLKRNEWTHIPYDRKERRKNLLGRRADKEHLIGYFSEEETCLLTPWQNIVEREVK